jgi:hypothetical protein
MAVRADEVQEGAFFVTADQELRKVFRLVTDEHGRTHVWYQCKSAIVANRPFLFGHSRTDAPSLEDFAAQCDHRLSRASLREFRERGILLEFE